MIDTLVFDIGNVLGKFAWEDYAKSFNFSDEAYDKIVRATFLSKYWPEFDRGALSDEEIINLCVSLEPEYEAEIRKIFEHTDSLVYEYDYSAQWLRELKERGYKIYLLSNYARSTFAYARSHFKFFDYVDGMVISYEINKVKPEDGIYEELIRRYDIVPQNAVFMDDLSVNIEGGKRHGFNTILFTTREQVLEELDAYLEK